MLRLTNRQRQTVAIARAKRTLTRAMASTPPSKMLYVIDVDPSESVAHRIRRAFVVPGGEYDVYVAVKGMRFLGGHRGAGDGHEAQGRG